MVFGSDSQTYVNYVVTNCEGNFEFNFIVANNVFPT